MRNLLILALSLAMGCGASFDDGAPVVLSSPDGHNEIRLWAHPLAYEVSRDGVTLVKKTEIGMKVDGNCLGSNVTAKCEIVKGARSGEVSPLAYKKDKINLEANELFLDFGDWGVRAVARNDGVAYRFETKLGGEIKVECEKAPLTIPSPDTVVWYNRTGDFGQEESIPDATKASEIRLYDNGSRNCGGTSLLYLPLAYSVGGKSVAVTESDVYDYPIWNFSEVKTSATNATLVSTFARWPKVTIHDGRGATLDKGGRFIKIKEFADYLTITAGTRTFPWRVFVLTDHPTKFCESDIVYALATPAVEQDFSWVKPGKATWEWWNCNDNHGGSGCTTKIYERFIDFAADNGIEYLIMDEGWSKQLNIWEMHPNIDTPHLIEYAGQKGVGIILWMAWAQIYGDEERVAEHFSKLGAKGFKVDFMDRGDADVTRFLERFAAACAKYKMVVDYHGVYRPVALHRKYPNVLNYEGIHGLENAKWHEGDDRGMMSSDVDAFYLRLTAGPMDYTPGAMINHPIGSDYRGSGKTPGSIGTRCRQLAMMILYEAPLQMLCDSPTNYEKNRETFDFMAKVPVVWEDVRGLNGEPHSYIIAARKSRDGSWYAAGLTDVNAREVELDTSFLGEGEWKAEIFSDAADADISPMHYNHQQVRTVSSGEKIPFKMAKGGGFAVKFTK